MDKKFKRWINLSSGTGTTLNAIVEKLARKPDQTYHTKDFTKNTIENNLSIIYDKSNVLITLIGYKNTVSPVICNNFHVVGLHPAPISLKCFEDYRGSNPIKKYWDSETSVPGENIIHLWGSVLYVCVPEPEKGTIIKSGYYGCSDRSECLDKNFQLNVKLWTEYLRGVLA
jgi:folate-dependent phosphoribosylglycinamide formyltransferase PurN